MPNATHTLTAPSSAAWRALTGKDTETISIYGHEDLNRRLAAAEALGVEVTVKELD